MTCGVKVTAKISVVEENTNVVLIPMKEYELVIQPLPIYYISEQVLKVQIKAMVEIKVINGLYVRMGKEPELAELLSSKQWKLNTEVVCSEFLEETMQ